MDSLRFIAVCLVVLFHFMGAIRTPGGLLDHLHYATWPFRVPLLVFVAGWFSSAEPPTKRSIVRLLQSIVAVYVLFEILQRVQIYLHRSNRVLRGDDILLDFDRPTFGMWFLLMLAILRILLPYIVRIRWFGLLAVLGALAIGFTAADDAFSLSRTFALLPIFLLGWYIRQSGLRERLTGGQVRAVAAGVVLGSLVVGWSLHGVVGRRMLNMSTPYRGFELAELGWRAALLLWGSVSVLAVFALIPRRKIAIVTVCGAGSMSAYILHQFVYRSWRNFGGPELATDYLSVGLTALGVLGLAILFMSPGFRRFFRPLIQPRATWFLRDREPISDVSPRGRRS